ncbi:MAG: hypothetical protein WAU02_02425 [Candidatus Saccharimonadales bacterium]
MTAEQRAGREQRRSAEFEVINELHEIATDVTERLGYPMNHLVDYEVVDGQAWCVTSIVPRPMVEITGQGVVDGRAKYTGDAEFQNVRLTLEHEEALAFDAMIRGEVPGNVMTVISPIPDIVVRRPDVIDGYRADLMRSLVRLYYITPDGRARCRMFSIDQSDPSVLMAIAHELHIPIDTWQGSEDMLARRGIHTMSSVTDDDIEMLAQRATDRVDQLLLERSRTLYYAGSKFSNVEDALSMVKRYPQLLEECRKKLRIIDASGLSNNEKRSQRERQLQLTVGAIHASIDGHEVHSSSDGVASSYVENNTYDADCPTGPSTLETAMLGQGKEIAMTCPFCGLTTMGDPCGFRIVCGKCDAEVRGGKLWSKGIGRTAALARRATTAVSNTGLSSADKKLSSDVQLQSARTLYGNDAAIKTAIAIGGVDTVIFNKKTNEVYAKL